MSAVFFILLALFPLAVSSAGMMTDIGALWVNGGNIAASVARDINDNGQIVGYSQSSIVYGDIHAFLYSNGTMTDLGTLGGQDSYAYGINNSGQIVGNSATTNYSTHAFLYSEGKMIDLGTLSEGDFSYAYSINNSGQIVGKSGGRAFLYSNGTMIDLGAPPAMWDDSYSCAYGINDSGLIVGEARFGSAYNAIHAAVYANGIWIDLSTITGDPLCLSLALGVNNSGQIVGSSEIDESGGGDHHAFRYPNGGNMTDLGLGISKAYGINDSDQIVGYHQTGSLTNITLLAFLYSNGTITDLGSLGGRFSKAYSINKSGQIVGYSQNASGTDRAFLYNPQPDQPDQPKSLSGTLSLLLGSD